MVNKMPTNVTNYIVLRDNSSLSSLSRQVEDFIEHGWEPQGGVAVMYDSRTDTTYVYQAMIKKIQ